MVAARVGFVILLLTKACSGVSNLHKSKTNLDQPDVNTSGNTLNAGTPPIAIDGTSIVEQVGKRVDRAKSAISKLFTAYELLKYKEARIKKGISMEGSVVEKLQGLETLMASNPSNDKIPNTTPTNTTASNPSSQSEAGSSASPPPPDDSRPPSVVRQNMVVSFGSKESTTDVTITIVDPRLMTEDTHIAPPAIEAGPVIDGKTSIENPNANPNQNPTPQTKDLDYVVVIRTYTPSNATMDRFQRIIESNPGVHIIIAINQRMEYELESSVNPVVARASYNQNHYCIQKCRERFGDRVYTYTDEDLITQFPTLNNLKKFRLGQIKMYSYAYYLHDEALVVILNKFQSKTGFNLANSGMFTLEDDLEYTGNWHDLFEKYGHRGYDLVSINYGDSYRFSEDPWADYASVGFRNFYVEPSAGFVAKHNEHIVYYSSSFRKTVEESLHKGYHMQSEMGTATVCRKFKCKHGSFERSDLDVEGFYLNCPKRHSPQEVKEHVEDLFHRGESVLVHPVKY